MNIRKLILSSEPPFEWNNDETHPIHSLGYYVFGIYDGFIFDEETVNNADEELLKKIYGEIASLENELSELKEFRDEKDKFIQECESKVREAKREAEVAIRTAKESEEKWKKARLHQLLGDYLTVGWKVGNSWEYGEKCNKCDENRKIHFTSPQGKKYTEDCQCAKRHYKYFPKEATLCKFYVRKENFGWDDNRYYTVVDCDDDYDRYERADHVYISSDDIDYEKVNSYNAVFLNEEDCQKFCDWKNKQELKK